MEQAAGRQVALRRLSGQLSAGAERGLNVGGRVHPTGQSPNLTPAAKSLIRRHKNGSLRWRKEGSARRITDFRGQNIAALEKRQTSITPDLRTELAARYEAGATIRELAAWSGAHRQTVVRHLIRAGAEFRQGGLTDEQSKKAERLYLDGLTIVEIADRLGVAASTVGRSLHGQGVALRPAVRRSIA